MVDLVFLLNKKLAVFFICKRALWQNKTIKRMVRLRALHSLKNPLSLHHPITPPQNSETDPPKTLRRTYIILKLLLTPHQYPLKIRKRFLTRQWSCHRKETPHLSPHLRHLLKTHHLNPTKQNKCILGAPISSSSSTYRANATTVTVNTNKTTPTNQPPRHQDTPRN